MKPKKHVVESMKAAASILGVDRTEVQWAKAEGCRAFRPGNRIDVGELRSWLRDKARKEKPPTVRDFDAGLEGAVALMRKWKGPANQVPVSFTPSATLMCWAVAGLKSMGCKKENVAIYVVREFMRDIRAGVGDELFRQNTSP